jgi:hypothetical protein
MIQNNEWNLHDLAFDFWPRGLVISPVRGLFYTGVLPSGWAGELPESAPDPLRVLVGVNHKNYTPLAGKMLLNYGESENFEVIGDEFGLGIRGVNRLNKPDWAGYVQNNQWYLNQVRATKISNWLRYIPGVKAIFLTGSSSLELAGVNSDLDFMLQVSPGFAWITRIWAKVILKLLGLDVHDFGGEIGLQKVRLFRKIGLIGELEAEAETLYYTQQIWQKKQNKGLVDIGLIFEKIESIEANFPKTTRFYYIWSSLQTFGVEVDYFGGQARYIADSNLVLSLLRAIFNLISLVLYPLFYAIYLLYKLKNGKSPHFIIQPDLICYFPVVDRARN